jgi:hypothetical protein
MFEQNRIFCPLSIAFEKPMPARNIAELLCDLGMLLRWRIRRGAGTDRGALREKSLRWDGQLALGFVSLPTSVQLRAMVEDWSLSRIQEALQSQLLETLRLQNDARRVSARTAGDSAPERRVRLEGDDLPTAV